MQALEPPWRILITWPTPVEWNFRARPNGTTHVSITASGFSGSDEEQAAQVIDAIGGFSFALAGARAFLEHGIELRLVADHNPNAHVRSAPSS